MVLSLLLCSLTLKTMQEAAVEGGPSRAECLKCLHCASFTRTAIRADLPTTPETAAFDLWSQHLCIHPHTAPAHMLHSSDLTVCCCVLLLLPLLTLVVYRGASTVSRLADRLTGSQDAVAPEAHKMHFV